MVVGHQVPLPESREQGRVQGLPDRGVSDAHVGIRGEGAGLGPAVGIDVEKAPARGDAAAGFLFVPGEGDEHDLRVFLPQPVDGRAHLFLLFLAYGQLPAFLRHRHVFDIDEGGAAPFTQRIDEGGGEDLAEVGAGHGDGRAEEEAAALQLVHVGHDLVIDPGTAAGVGGLPAPFQAHHRQQVAAAVQQVEVFFVQKNAVGEDGEQYRRDAARGLDHVPPEQRFAAGQQYIAHADVGGLAEDLFPFRRGKLLLRFFVQRGLGAAGIAAGAVQVAVGGDGGHDEGGDVLPLLFQSGPAAGGLAGGGGKAQHEGAFLGMAQRGAQGIGHHLFHASGQIIL